MSVVECEIPALSALDRRQVEVAYFWDSYRAPLRHGDTSVTDIFLAVFAHHPIWMKVILMARNRVASLFGLDAPAASEILNPAVGRDYRVGDTIGVWPIFALSETELVAGRDNKHLDFRLSVLKSNDDTTASVTVSTICVVHNRAGKIYLFFIVPFHKWGVRWLISRAIRTGRL
ncbi:MAG: DUF2867 domain-containing protein [Rhizobiales bacterium]|nr:DUF2867 domain-containing protein [Hyphomicrobiales bacterium]